MSSKHLPKTTAFLRITQQSWQEGILEGEIIASDFVWQFQWNFKRRQLAIAPSRGRALIQEPLGRFLEKYDYQLEPGSDYSFIIRAEL
ncbi:MAG: DUF3146 family protein [Oscillatoriaceae bacterium SKYG93]|nr:DUF3146 family protein [Oscillatoriaceae bacterium SKYG93]MDW8452487.1 DUF3146 family protein [Oscillatoriaceae cyanobacterium SKYGB_i_bin93]